MAQVKSQFRPASAAVDFAADNRQGLVSYPTRGPAIRLLGEMRDSGYQNGQWLVERDGQFLQLTEVLYRVLDRIDGTRTPAEVADAVTSDSDWEITEEQVQQLL